MFRHFLLLHQNKAALSLGFFEFHPFFWRLACAVVVIFRILQTSSKLDQLELVMKKMSWDLSQSERRDYNCHLYL